ncbi:MAG: type II toxin-antitoxin system VapC family toxin [Bifidobacteriaceae bacterium]|jgi:PIN domain nuclease of toxin-antitoxin system|nr:type II toxin-antitoxin system VapC family toxin [Bifidobacteriaceae bacterium]
MKLLADTHALLWAIQTPERLGPAAIAVIKDSSNTVMVSSATTWELGIKAKTGKLPEALPLLADYTGALRRLGATTTPITDQDALLAASLPWAHQDPFDRMLAAQALTRNLVLVSRDAAFDRVPGLRRIW